MYMTFVTCIFLLIILGPIIGACKILKYKYNGIAYSIGFKDIAALLSQMDSLYSIAVLVIRSWHHY